MDTLINATERDGEQIRQPSETIAEKVAFIFNNLCISNLQQKVISNKITNSRQCRKLKNRAVFRLKFLRLSKLKF